MLPRSSEIVMMGKEGLETEMHSCLWGTHLPGKGRELLPVNSFLGAKLHVRYSQSLVVYTGNRPHKECLAQVVSAGIPTKSEPTLDPK